MNRAFLLCVAVFPKKMCMQWTRLIINVCWPSWNYQLMYSHNVETAFGCVIWVPVRILHHYDDVIMGAIASQITSLRIVYSTDYSKADQRKHQSSASLALCGEFTEDRWIPLTNGQWRGKCSTKGNWLTSDWGLAKHTCVCELCHHWFSCLPAVLCLLNPYEQTCEI